MIKAVRTDNVHEIAFIEHVTQHGIAHQFSCAYTLQQNSLLKENISTY